MASEHSHPVEPVAVRLARSAVLGRPESERLAALLALLSDATRLRVLFALASVDELCVGDVALALDISMDQSSYALKVLRGAGLVAPRRAGRVIYHRLAEGFPHQLLEHCLRDLLTMSDRGQVA